LVNDTRASRGNVGAGARASHKPLASANAAITSDVLTVDTPAARVSRTKTAMASASLTASSTPALWLMASCWALRMLCHSAILRLSSSGFSDPQLCRPRISADVRAPLPAKAYRVSAVLSDVSFLTTALELSLECERARGRSPATPRSTCAVAAWGCCCSCDCIIEVCVLEQSVCNHRALIAPGRFFPEGG